MAEEKKASFAEATAVAASTTSISESEKESRYNTVVEKSPEGVAAIDTHNGADLANVETKTSHTAGAELQEVPTREDGTEYPSTFKLGIITVALCLSVFLMALGKPPFRPVRAILSGYLTQVFCRR